jgi:hypothetical protein
VTFPLPVLSAAIAARAEIWTSLRISWSIRPIDPNHGKAVIVSEFQAADWLGDISIWTTGEAELETVRLTDDRMVNKHCDLTGPADLETLLDELISLLADDRVPTDAVVTQAPGPPA